MSVCRSCHARQEIPAGEIFALIFIGGLAAAGAIAVVMWRIGKSCAPHLQL